MDWQQATWRAIPSANILFPRDGLVVKWSIIADGETLVLVLSDIADETVAKYIVNSHNLLLSKP